MCDRVRFSAPPSDATQPALCLFFSSAALLSTYMEVAPSCPPTSATPFFTHVLKVRTAAPAPSPRPSSPLPLLPSPALPAALAATARGFL